MLPKPWSKLRPKGKGLYNRQCCLPSSSPRIKPLQSQTYNTFWKEFRVKMMRHSMLWKNWQNWPYDRYFQEKFFMKLYSCIFPTWKSTRSINEDVCSSWLAATFYWDECLISGTHHQTHIYTDLPHPHLFRTVLSAFWETVSWATVLSLVHIKFSIFS